MPYIQLRTPLKINLDSYTKTLTLVPTMLEMSSRALTFAANLIYTLKKKRFKAIAKGFRVLYLREPLLLNKSF
jgi:hypothetical protein